MSEINAMQLLEQMQSLAKKTTIENHDAQNTMNRFSTVLIDQINNINTLQKESAAKQKQYALGDASLSLPQVVVATQKASIYTQFLIEIRNKGVEACNQIMNMPVQWLLI